MTGATSSYYLTINIIHEFRKLTSFILATDKLIYHYHEVLIENSYG